MPKTRAMTVLAVLGIALAIAWIWWDAERVTSPFSIGILHPTTTDAATFQGFRDRFIELGHVEGEDVIFLYDGPEGRGAALENAARDLVAADVDLIFSSGTPATQAANHAARGTGIPIVFGPVNDPVGAGLVASLRHPGGTLTGVTLPASNGVRLKWLRNISPSVTRVLMPYSPNDGSSLASVRMAEEAATVLGVDLTLKPVRNTQELHAMVDDLPPDVDALFIPRDAQITAEIEHIQAAAIRQGVALSAPGLNQVRRGALMSYGFSHAQVGRKAADIADKILAGTSPNDLPVETARSFLAVNLNTAAQIGIEIPDALLRQALEITR